MTTQPDTTPDEEETEERTLPDAEPSHGDTTPE